MDIAIYPHCPKNIINQITTPTGALISNLIGCYLVGDFTCEKIGISYLFNDHAAYQHNTVPEPKT